MSTQTHSAPFRGLRWLFFALLHMGACMPLMAQVENYSALVQANQPQFAARLVTPSSPDQGSLLNLTPAATMEYRIISERMNNRRFFQLIADAIAVNSNAKMLSKNAGYISRSRSAVPLDLQPNDSLSFVFDGKNTVTMSLNGTQLASYESADFFRMLLSTWVGEVPISSRFKREILGRDTAPKETVALFTQAIPSAARKQEVSQAAITPAKPVAAAVVASAPTPKPLAATATSVKPAPVNLEPATPKPTTPKPATPKPTTPEPKVAKTEPKPATPVPAPAAKVEVKTPAAATVTKATPPPARSAPPSTAPAQVASAIPSPQPEHEELSEEEEARRLLLRQEYLKGLNRDINIHKHLPPAAFSRRAEGSVRLAISLDKNGKLLNVEVVEPARHNMFNEQALEAVKGAQPFSPPPSELESDPFEFETTLYYDLPL